MVRFSQKNNSLIRHAQIHTGKKYQCSICEKAFVTNEKLIRHTKTHSEKKTYQCSICELTFFRKKYLVEW